MSLTREEITAHIGYAVDDSGNRRSTMDIPDPDTNVRYVGWQCGFEPMFVAVWSYLPNLRIDDDDAAELATDLLIEIAWFEGGPAEPDHIL